MIAEVMCLRYPHACYSAPVSRNATRLLADALKLPEPERVVIASELLDSVVGGADPAWTAAWEEELAARAARVRSGEEATASWDDVRNWIARRLAGP